MSVEFFHSDELFLVEGRPADLLDELQAGRVITNRIAGVVVTRQRATHLYPVDMLDELLDDLLTGRLARVQAIERLERYR